MMSANVFFKTILFLKCNDFLRFSSPFFEITNLKKKGLLIENAWFLHHQRDKVIYFKQAI